MAEGVDNRISGGIFLAPVIQGRDLILSLPPEITPARAGLPWASPGFCGRAPEMSTLLSALSPHPAGNDSGPESLPAPGVLAVCGLAGVGKTELVLQAAHTALASGWFPGGVLFADLLGHNPAGQLAPGQALAGFLSALGVLARQIPPGAQDRERLCELILSAFARRGRRILVLLDDAAAGGHAERLLRASRDHQVVLTSRDRPGLAADRQVLLNVLAPSASVELLRSILDMAHPGDARVRDDPGSGARIADLCDGLPLALRIAGALLAENPALPLATVAENLRDERSRLDELSYPGGAVRASFGLSYQRLDPQAARLFRLLPVNPGPDFSIAAAAALAGQDPEVTRRALAALGYLVEPGPGADRWRMPDLVRLYADEHGLRQAREDDRAKALARLLDHYLAATRAAVARLRPGRPGPSADRALAWLNAERANLAAAADAAAASPAHAAAAGDLAQAMIPFLKYRGDGGDRAE
jgi:NB-ARC domain